MSGTENKYYITGPDLVFGGHAIGPVEAESRVEACEKAGVNPYARGVTVWSDEEWNHDPLTLQVRRTLNRDADEMIEALRREAGYGQ